MAKNRGGGEIKTHTERESEREIERLSENGRERKKGIEKGRRREGAKEGGWGTERRRVWGLLVINRRELDGLIMF